MAGAKPEHVSDRAKERQRREMGTLGSGNHYLEVQAVAEIFDAAVAEAFGLAQDDVVVTIHCGSRGLGHQIGTEFLKEMVVDRAKLRASSFPIASSPARRSTRRSASATWAPCARRSIARSPTARFSATTRGGFSRTSSRTATCACLFDVSHNTCKVEEHARRRQARASCSFIARARPGPSVPVMQSLPEALRPVGQPVLIGGSMGTGSYILVGETAAEEKAFSSACHGAGRAMSRHAGAQALERPQDRRRARSAKGS